VAELPGTLKLVTVWLLLGLALFLGVSWWQAQQRQTRITLDGGTIEIRRSGDGHYHWRGRIDGPGGAREVDFLVDTGATATALPQRLAEQLQLEPEAQVRSSTAGGVVQGYVARVDIELEGGVHVRRLPVTVLPALERPLLGMDILSKMRFSQQSGVLRIEPGTGARP
jgi:aspartyl protease family protein